mmetsp:Transcript_44099/g.122681  ORF Transcript_44099/g.122681 Transcript_44099/m.122681 type:complete len:217 (+) Transcript_44099:137-787(+)
MVAPSTPATGTPAGQRCPPQALPSPWPSARALRGATPSAGWEGCTGARIALAVSAGGASCSRSRCSATTSCSRASSPQSTWRPSRSRCSPSTGKTSRRTGSARRPVGTLRRAPPAARARRPPQGQSPGRLSARACSSRSRRSSASSLPRWMTCPCPHTPSRFARSFAWRCAALGRAGSSSAGAVCLAARGTMMRAARESTEPSGCAIAVRRVTLWR